MLDSFCFNLLNHESSFSELAYTSSYFPRLPNTMWGVWTPKKSKTPSEEIFGRLGVLVTSHFVNLMLIGSLKLVYSYTGIVSLFMVNISIHITIYPVGKCLFVTQLPQWDFYPQVEFSGKSKTGLRWYFLPNFDISSKWGLQTWELRSPQICQRPVAIGSSRLEMDWYVYTHLNGCFFFLIS